MTIWQCCPQCRTPMPCYPDGRWYIFLCPCGYQGYPLRYSVTSLQSGSTHGTLSGGFAAWDAMTPALPFAVSESDLPAWARPDREPVPNAFQQAFAEGELEL